MPLNVGVKTNIRHITASRLGLWWKGFTPTILRGRIINNAIAQQALSGDVEIEIDSSALFIRCQTCIEPLSFSGVQAERLSEAGIEEIVIPQGMTAKQVRVTLNTLSSERLWRARKTLERKNIEVSAEYETQTTTRDFPKDHLFYIDYLKKTDLFDEFNRFSKLLRSENRRRGLKFDRINFLAAAGFMVYAHEGVKRKSGDYYAIHPKMVSQLLYDFAHHVDQATHIAALLHDTIEDVVEVDEELIKELFGNEVAFLVNGMTKLDEAAEEENIDHFIEYVQDDIRLLLLKLVDRGHNLSTSQFLSQASQVRNAEETLEFYVPLAWAAGFAKAARHLADISLQVLSRNIDYVRKNPDYADLAPWAEKYTPLNNKIAQELADSKSTLDNLERRIANAYHGQSAISISRKPRTAFELLQIAAMRGTEEHKLSDIVMMQISVETVEDCFGVYNLIAGLGTPLDSYFHDYINDPKINGYQSLHCAIEYQGKIVRFQIRTPGMQRKAEQGVLAEAYKEKAYQAPSLPWFTSQYLRELLNPEASAKEKVVLLKALSAALMTTVFVDGPELCQIEERLIPPNISPLDIAFIVNPNTGMRLVTATMRDIDVAEDETDQPVARRIGSINLHLRRETLMDDYLSILTDPVARRNYIEFLNAISEYDQRFYARSILINALAGYCITINDVIDLQAELFDSLDGLEQLIIAIGQGNISAKAAAEKVVAADRNRKNTKKQALLVEFEIGNLDEELIFIDVIDPLRRLIGNLENIRMQKYPNGEGYVSLRVAYQTDLQRRQIQNFFQEKYALHKVGPKNKFHSFPKLTESDPIFDFPVFWLDDIVPGSSSFNLLAARKVQEDLATNGYFTPIFYINPSRTGLLTIPLGESERVYDAITRMIDQQPEIQNNRAIILSAPKDILIDIATLAQKRLQTIGRSLVLIDIDDPRASVFYSGTQIQKMVERVLGYSPFNRGEACFTGSEMPLTSAHFFYMIEKMD